MKIISILNKIIEFSFYALFLITPLVFSSATSELFEFPKMWLVFGLTVLIGTAWIMKMILQKRAVITRTPLDIPLLLFLASQIASTIFSLDPHVSLWGYYSRFNGGLLSITAYVFLYFALASNFTVKQVLKLLSFSLYSGLIVAVWGLPSHFGYDPTCFVFRQSFDTSCWTDAFKPTIRMFSTLGQPAWLAAFMAALIPVSLAYFLKNKASNTKEGKNNLPFFFLALAVLFYIDLTYTNTRGGFIGFWVANIVFWAIVIARRTPEVTDEAISKNNKRLPRSLRSLAMTWKYFFIINLIFIGFNFLQGLPISQVSKFTLPELINNDQTASPASQNTLPAAGALGGTDSGQIRLLVWRGAIDAWQEKPLFGTGVETFAFAYYQHKPAEHNLTSEWDYLYNKAHNEYLNYLTTTGIFGLGSYLLIIGLFLFSTCKWLMANGKLTTAKTNSENHKLYAICYMLVLGLLAGYISILISNFFGFSVVITNLYFFLIPAIVFLLSGIADPEKVFIFPNRPSQSPDNIENITISQWFLIALTITITSILSFSLLNYWRADRLYSIGSGLNKGGAYQEAFPSLLSAASIKPKEPVYNDELSLNMATLASALHLQKEEKDAATLTEEAIKLNDELVTKHPNNIVYWKNRVRLFFTLAQADKENEKKYLQAAHAAISKAHELSPNDAKVAYNLAVMEGQLGDTEKAIQMLEETIKLKPDYRDAYHALGIFYDEIGNRQKATEALEYILKNIDPTDKETKETLKSWK